MTGTPHRGRPEGTSADGTCAYCSGSLGQDGGVVHDACESEWRRRARQKICVMCGEAGSGPLEFSCGACQVMDSPPYRNYARRDS